MNVARLGGAVTAAAFAFANALLCTRADDTPPQPAALAASALHLLGGARYSEAIPAAQQLVETAPAEPLAYQIRGTLELHIGSVPAARRDFAMAARLLPSNPVTEYGQVLTDLEAGNVDAARNQAADLSRMAGLSEQQAQDAQTLDAYLEYLSPALNAPLDDPLPVSADTTDPLRAELRAMVAARRQPAQGTALLTAFLTTSSGVPSVTEENGLRPLFAADRPLEAAVIEPSLQRLYQSSLADILGRSRRGQSTTLPLTGTVTVAAPAEIRGAASIVSVSIDGQAAGILNSAPFDFLWQTATCANGVHAVRFDALDSSGTVIRSTTRRFAVHNAHPAVTQGSLAADAGLEDGVEDLLRLRPSYKAAQWALADIDREGGDIAAAQAHEIVAAAIDPNYRDARRIVRAAFSVGPAHASLTEQADKMAGLTAGSPARREVALTFDDGPNPAKTPALLDALEQAGAPATFFVVGSRAQAAPDLVRRMVSLGDDVENHSYTHPNMAMTAPTIAESEILRASVVIQSLTGREPRFFRPPGGDRNPVVYRLAALYGQRIALWTVDALHYEESGSPQQLTAYVAGHVHPGSIVLMHNGLDNTTAAVPLLVAALRAQGYQLVTVTQITAQHEAVSIKAVSVTGALPSRQVSPQSRGRQ